jgi:2,4-dienoyl-CoA reductase-like NADH-dependent reductase (Old Yellow Enzyme family)
MKIFEAVKLGSCNLKNRIIRSATFEGMCDGNGFPKPNYFTHYKTLAENDIGAIITGFAYISNDGRAMQPGQAGMDTDLKIPYYKKLTTLVHKYDCKIFMQIAHSGRQTRQSITGDQVKSCSSKRSFYFGEKPRELSLKEIYLIVEKFGNAALYAKEAGFDGVQIHGAHGYLVHQFIIKSINKRDDEFGVDKRIGIGTWFLHLIIDKIREKCGSNFTVLIKVSGSDDYWNRFSKIQFKNLIMFLNKKPIDGIEISYGTMDYALNIFRGNFPTELILARNPIFKSSSRLDRIIKKNLIFPLIRIKLKPFTPMYNLHYAILAQKYSQKPIITVGGFGNSEDISYAIGHKNIDFVSLCRAFIAEPDFLKKIRKNSLYQSRCVHCNYCVIMCDSQNETKCYQN